MIGLIETAAEIQSFCEDQSWSFCIIGGVAVQFWGEPRLTRDVDLNVITGFGGEGPVIEKLLEKYIPRREDAGEFAKQNRVLLIKTADDIGIDVSLGAIPFEEEMARRAVSREFLPGTKLRICTPEDLIVLKAFADRPQDWLDIRGVVQKQDALDWSYVFCQLRPLVELKEEPAIITKLEALRSTIS